MYAVNIIDQLHNEDASQQRISTFSERISAAEVLHHVRREASRYFVRCTANGVRSSAFRRSGLTSIGGGTKLSLASTESGATGRVAGMAQGPRLPMALAAASPELRTPEISHFGGLLRTPSLYWPQSAAYVQASVKTSRIFRYDLP